MKLNLRSPKMLGLYIVAFTLIALGVARFSNFNPQPKLPPEEIAKLREYAEQGDYETGAKLASMYEHGWRGVKQDYKEAYVFLSISYVQGELSELNTVREKVVELGKHLSPQEKLDADRSIREWIAKNPNFVVRKPPTTSDSLGPN